MLPLHQHASLEYSRNFLSFLFFIGGHLHIETFSDNFTKSLRLYLIQFSRDMWSVSWFFLLVWCRVSVQNKQARIYLGIDDVAEKCSVVIRKTRWLLVPSRRDFRPGRSTFRQPQSSRQTSRWVQKLPPGKDKVHANQRSLLLVTECRVWLYEK